MDLGALAEKEYPGRFIILGRDPTGQHDVAVYGMTGRKDKTKARKLRFDSFHNRVYVAPTGQENQTFLHYIAMCMESGSVAIGDGKRVEIIEGRETDASIAEDIFFSTGTSPDKKIRFIDPFYRVAIALGRYDYKKDSSSTPRIGGYIDRNGAALGIVRREKDGSSAKSVREVPLISGEGRLISTYDGPNLETAPAFASQPLEIALPFSTAQELADAVYSVLRPDTRIGVAVLYSPVSGSTIGRQLVIKNKVEELAGVR